MLLYSYYRSSAAYRVRIALHLKQLPYTYQPVHLLREGGQQFSAAYQACNPQALVPTLQVDEQYLMQSLAIIEYLEECYPEPRLLPESALQRAQVRAMAQAIACDIHPLNNLRVLKYLKNELNLTDEQKSSWYQHWIQTGFHAIEQQLQTSAGRYCFGDQVTLADVCLIPQVYNALRFACDMTPYPHMLTIYENCARLPAFQQAAPEQQPDAE